MTKRKSKSSLSKLVKFAVLGLVGVALLILALTLGNDVALYNPKGQIAQDQFHLMMFVSAVLLFVAIPTLSLLYFFAWKYRETNTSVVHNPHARHGKFFALSLWVIPVVTLIVLASVMWPATHKLDPHKQISNGKKPLTIQVIALQWKWLFVYPEQNIASVNFVQIPVDRPIQFELTADEAPMNSFWIPHLGGQLYAMSGHSNQLNLMADTTGDFPGQAAEINGEGFAGMKFVARASTEGDFQKWIAEARGSANVLDAAEYKKLLKPSEDNPAVLYSTVDANLYDKVLMKYGGSHGSHMEQE